MLCTCLRSLKAQLAHDFEVIVVNDGGPDIEPIVNYYGRKPISYVKHDRNRGLGSARNTGIKVSRGKYLMFLDDDDVLYPNHISTLASFLNGKQAQVAFTDSHRAHHCLDEGQRLIRKEEKIPILPIDYSVNKMLSGNFIPVCCVMFEKKILDRVGYFDEELESHEDWDLWSRMAIEGIHFWHIREITCEISWRPDTMTSNKSIMDTGRNKVFSRNKMYLTNPDKKLIFKNRSEF